MPGVPIVDIGNDWYKKYPPNIDLPLTKNHLAVTATVNSLLRSFIHMRVCVLMLLNLYKKFKGFFQ